MRWRQGRRSSNVEDRRGRGSGVGRAAAIGDDRMQRRAGGSVHPESWTHGSSEQRVRWLRRGLESGRIDACDTFGTDRL